MSQTEVRKENVYEKIIQEDVYNGEILLAREDRLRILINKDGTMVTHFPDDTRITTWIEEESIFIDDDDKDSMVIKLS